MGGGIMAVVINGTTGIDKVQDGSIQTADLAANAVTTAKIANTVNLGRRNLIINGAMQVAQRGTSFTVSNDNWLYLMDRFQFDENGASGAVLDITQSTDAPDGFSYSLKVDVSTADAALASGDGLRIQHKIEAQNLQHLGHGTSSAKPVTLSFWVKSNTTGTNTIWVYKQDSSSQTSFAYTVNAADTWEYKTITIPADTSGAIDNNNDQGMMISWYLAAGTDFNSGTLASSWESLTNANRAPGQVNNFSSTSNYWAITGVQLEVGDTATPFEHRSYAEELLACQRYYWDTNSDRYNDNYIGAWKYNTSWYWEIFLPVEMRTIPTATYTYNTNYIIWSGSGNTTYTDAANSLTLRPGTNHLRVYTGGTTRGSPAEAGMITLGNAGGSTSRQQYYLDAEL